jgi:lysophosphatidylcholine acyltransferase/lyso-PAF acetyltransferase
MSVKRRSFDSSSPTSPLVSSSSSSFPPLPSYPFDFDDPSVTHFTTSHSDFLDSFSFLGFSLYELITFVHLIFFHFVTSLLLSPSWTVQCLCWSIQLSIAVYLYYNVFSCYIDDTRGNMKGAARFRLDPPPGFSPDFPSFPPLLFNRQTSSYAKLNSVDINPFVNNTFWITRRECIRLSLSAVTLFPVRLLFSTLSLCGVALFCLFAMIGIDKKKDMKKPFSPLRRALFHLPVMILSRVILMCCGYYWISTYGRKASADEAPIIISNHVTFLEPVYLISQYLASPIAAAENLKAPILSTICRALQTIQVDRNDPLSRSAVVETMKTRAKEKGWPTTIVFPEGSCTNGRYIIQFKPGAFIVGKPVQPIAVHYPSGSRICPAWSSSVNSVLMLLVRMLCEPFNRMNVYFLPVYNPSPEEISDVSLYANNVRQVLQQVLRQPAVPCSVEDMQLAQKLWTPIVDRVGPKKGEIAMFRSKISHIEWSKMKSIVPELDWSTTLAHLKRFQSADYDYQGVLSLAGFAKSLNRPESPELMRFFQWLNHDGSGTVHFMEFLIGVALFCNGTPDQALDSAFQVYSSDGKLIEKSTVQWLWNTAHAAEIEVLEAVWKSNFKERNTITLEEFKQLGRNLCPQLLDALRKVFLAPIPDRKSKRGDEKKDGTRKQE